MDIITFVKYSNADLGQSLFMDVGVDIIFELVTGMNVIQEN